MDNYAAPEGYIYDKNTGLYYTQIIAVDEQGNQSQVVNWFNPETGEYTQNVYPIDFDDQRKRNMVVTHEEVTGYDGVDHEYADASENGESFKKWIIIGIGGILLLVFIIITVHFATNSNEEKSENKKEQSEISEIEITDSEIREITVEDGIRNLDITADSDASLSQEETNAPSDADGYVSEDIYGVYKNDEMIVVVAPGVEHYQAAADGVYDMGTSENPDFWILRYEPESEYMYFGTNVSLENEVIIDYTENESGHAVNMAYGCMGMEMTYYELTVASGQQRDILLKKTKEDPVKAYYYYVDMYNEMVR